MQKPARTVHFTARGALVLVPCRVGNWSGRLDSNQRPPAPEAGALPDCATPRTYGGCRTKVHLVSLLGALHARPTPQVYQRFAVLGTTARLFPANILNCCAAPAHL